MQPDENIPLIHERLAHWLRGHYGRNATKRLMSDFGVSGRAAEYALSGEFSAQLFRRLLAGFGAPLAQFIFQPADCASDRDAYLSYLDTLDHDAHAAFAAAGFPLGAGFTGGARACRGGRRDGSSVAGSGVGTAGRSAPVDGRVARASWLRSFLDAGSQAADELKAFRGAVDLNEDIGIGAVTGCQSDLLGAWQASGGELSDSLIGAIDGVGLAGFASVFDNQMRVRRIGPATGLWTDEQRLGALGRDMGDLPAPLPYLQAVRESLQSAVTQRAPLHHRISVRVGDVAKTYRRLALPCPRSGVVLSVSLLEAA